MSVADLALLSVLPAEAGRRALVQLAQVHPDNQGANLKSISHRCHPIMVEFVKELTKETIHLPLGCRGPGPPERSASGSRTASPRAAETGTSETPARRARI